MDSRALENSDGAVEFSPLRQDPDVEDMDADDFKVTFETPIEDGRAKWGSKLQFLLSCISLSVGLGNVWRFPYLVQQDGGGAFLIPYMIMMFMEGMPLFLIELGIGQRLRQGSLGSWNLVHPWLGGIGIAATMVSFLVGLYYNVIICWCFYYFFNSFTSPLPWSVCPTNGNTTIQECELSSETQYFWYRTAIDASPSIGEPQGVKWWMALCLLLAWIIVYLSIMRGIQSSGKVVYFTAIFPYIILIIFFGRAVTLKGAYIGLAHMFTPKMEALMNPTVWMDAATQVFYSLGVGFGSLIAFASYNPMDNNCTRDAVFMSFITVFTAIFGAIDIFAVLGFKAVSNYEKCLEHNMGRVMMEYPGRYSSNLTVNEIERILNADFGNGSLYHPALKHCSISEILDQAAEGTGLTFVVFTQAIVELPGSNFWAVCFFLMLLALGLGSQFGTMEGVITNLFDMNIRIRKEFLTGIVCASSYLIGLLFVTGAGEYWVKTFDSFAGTVGLVVIAFFEIVSVIFVYGHERFSGDIEKMTGKRPGLYWQVTWRFLSPVSVLIIFIASIIHRAQHPPTYNSWDATQAVPVKSSYPDWALAFAVFLMLCGSIPIPIVFLIRRFQCVKFDTDIQQASIKRIDTTASTTGMMKAAELEDYTDAAPNGDLNGTVEVEVPLTSSRFQMEVVD